MPQKNYYDILNIGKSASAEEIKKAYHKLAKQYHPDRNQGDKESEKKFKQINEAYEVLKDLQKKAAYDRFGHDAFTQQASGGGRGSASSNPNVNDIFGDFFNDFMGARSSGPKKQSSLKGSDLQYNLTITLEEAFRGVDKNITFSSAVKCTSCDGKGGENSSEMSTCNACGGKGITRIQQGFFTLEQTCNKCQGAGNFIKNPCKKCHATGRNNQQRNLLVNIPSGVEEGTKIRLVGEGEAGVRGGNNGDLYIFIAIQPHGTFKVEGTNIHCKISIGMIKAALGGKVEVPLIEGGKITIDVPAGSQYSDRLRLKDKGMSKVRSQTRGDMFVHVHIIVPQNLTKKQIHALELASKEFNDDENHISAFDKIKNLWS